MPTDDEAGFSLIDIIFAMLILSTAIAALTATLITGVRASSIHRNLTTTDTVLRSYAEAVKQGVRDSCTGATTTFAPVAITYDTAAYTPSVVGNDNVCPAASPGWKRVSVQVVGPAGTKNLDLVLRRP